MVQFNTKDNEILVKVVFYGTGLSGKTTNLQKLHEMTDPTQKTDLFSVNTMQDRTLFFDLLPLDLGYVYGNSIKLQIYTVPGQVHYDSTRRIVLSGADGVVFVADSNQSKLQDNIQSINNLYHNLQANRLNIKEVPLVMQYNKRDLPNSTSVDVLEQKLNFRNVPYFEAVAIEGKGVLETFLETVKMTVRYIFTKYQLSKNVKNVDGVIEKLETSIMAQAANNKAAKEKSTAKPEAAQTVLKYTHDYKPEDDKGSQDQLLKKALTSNMETAQLYTSLKKSKAALQKKQDELQTLYKQLEKSNHDNLKMRRFLESLVNFAGEAIITFNEMWVIQNWNQAAEELFGYRRDAVLNKNINILFPKDSIADLNRVLAYVMNGKVVRGFETSLKTKSEFVLPVNITFSPIKNQNESIIAFTAIVRDLSFMARISKQLKIIQRFESVSSLLPGVVAKVKAAVPQLPAEIKPLLDTVDILSRPDKKAREAVDLNDIIRRVHQLLEMRLRADGVSWSHQLFPNLPTVPLNLQLITRALLNLFLNSLDAMADRPDGKLTVGTHHGNAGILLQIIDNGRGLSSEEIERSADTSLSNRKSLVDMRLNATREIIKAQGGTMRVDSAAGKGTKVTVKLPG